MAIEIGNFILIPTKNQSKEDWLKQRSLTVGVAIWVPYSIRTNIARLLNLFYEKLGRFKPVILADNSAVHYGSSFEDVVLRDSSIL